uniref:NADH-ubiquinone oxidoreductase chain 4L n=1 Tax=Owenia fusiformis TaxID=6347 RepID=A0A0S2N0E6_OWEFU|nr:NADH dehydrogenase subunit 4L [Owenia fusiformis]ALO81697.1 NADH dehydrogenase subunit 4L [Owenia fusiformis]
MNGFIFSLVVVFSGMITLSLQSVHLLGSLLSLEMMMLGLFFFYSLVSCVMTGGEVYLGLIILTFGVCEASLGLALFVSMVRSHGVDYVTVFCLN